MPTKVPILTDRQRANFEDKIDRSGDCHVWTASTIGSGYGQFGIISSKSNFYAHRLSYLLNVGEIPDGMKVCHRCDNPPCVNPAHLFIGTQLDNMRDCKSKGRLSFGESCYNTKLKNDSVIEIRKIYADGKTLISAIAKSFGVSRAVVNQIVYRKTWRHLA